MALPEKKYDTERSAGGRITWEEFKTETRDAKAILKAKRPAPLPLEMVRLELSKIYEQLDMSGAGIVPRVDLERDIMQMAYGFPRVRYFYHMIEARDEMVVEVDDYEANRASPHLLLSQLT